MESAIGHYVAPLTTTEKCYSKVALVPITHGTGLKSGTDQSTLPPSNCIKACRSGSTTAVAMASAISFANTTDGTSKDEVTRMDKDENVDTEEGSNNDIRARRESREKDVEAAKVRTFFQRCVSKAKTGSRSESMSKSK